MLEKIREVVLVDFVRTPFGRASKKKPGFFENFRSDDLGIAALTGAVSGLWEIEDADKGAGVAGFTEKDSLWQIRRRLAKDFWIDK